MAEFKIIHEVIIKEFHNTSNVEKILRKLVEQNNLIIKNQKIIMAKQEQFEQAFEQVNEATTKIGAGLTAVAGRITSLEETIGTLGLPAEQERAILAKLQGISPVLNEFGAALESMAQTPEAPVPDNIPDVPEETDEDSSDLDFGTEEDEE